MKDERVVYGARCTWWDSIDKVAKHINGLPRCPHCGSVLFERPSEQTFLDGAKRYERDGHPGYVEFLHWQRGKCFPNMAAAQEAFDAERSAQANG